MQDQAKCSPECGNPTFNRDKDKKIVPVSSKAVATISDPLLRLFIYMFKIGPSVKPRTPVRQKTQKIPEALFLFLAVK